MKAIETTGAKVLISLVPKEEMKDGFYMPDSHRAENVVGAVEVIGPECKTVVVGRKVIVKDNVGTEVDLSEISASQGSTYRVVEEKDILIMY